MKKFKPGDIVRINMPGSVYHGMTGPVVREENRYGAPFYSVQLPDEVIAYEEHLTPVSKEEALVEELTGMAKRIGELRKIGVLSIDDWGEELGGTEVQMSQAMFEAVFGKDGFTGATRTLVSDVRFWRVVDGVKFFYIGILPEVL